MVSLHFAASVYLSECAAVRRLSPHTLAAYKCDLRDFLRSLPTRRKVTHLDVRECLLRIADNPGLAPRTVRRRIAAVRAFLRAVAPRLARDTFDSWKISTRIPIQLPRSIDARDLRALLTATAPDMDRALVNTTRLCLLILAATGLRVSELCALTIERVRLETGEIVVLGKGARERVVLLTNTRLRQAVGDHIARLPTPSGPKAPLFRNSRGQALTAQCLRLRLHRLAREVSLCGRITPHMLRHTAATRLLERGVDTRFVQRLLGHASIATTQIYTQVTDASLRRALESADAVGEFL